MPLILKGDEAYLDLLGVRCEVMFTGDGGEVHAAIVIGVPEGWGRRVVAIVSRQLVSWA